MKEKNNSQFSLNLISLMFFYIKLPNSIVGEPEI
jgi:hypothetical protein